MPAQTSTRPPRAAASFEQALAAAPMSEGLRALARRGERRQLRKGTQIITEGDFGDTLYIVISGALRAFGADVRGGEYTYGIYGPGEYVGEMGLDGGPRAADVACIEASVVVLVTRPTLEAHLREQPAFAFELLAKVIGRARRATRSLKQLALMDVYGRLKLLLEEAAAPADDGTRTLDPAPSHLEISQQLGCSRAMVSRLMKDLERGEYVRVGRRRVVLKKALPAEW
jgi:CRP/FNR family transcriptional regulator, cyclic AMP receptor protein